MRQCSPVTAARPAVLLAISTTLRLVSVAVKATNSATTIALACPAQFPTASIAHLQECVNNAYPFTTGTDRRAPWRPV